MKVNIHNQCSDFKLINRGYFSDGSRWNRYLAEEVDPGGMVNIEFKYSLATFEGALAYKLQRGDVKSNGQFEPTCILLFVAWKSDGYRKICAYVRLLEYDEWFYWNETKLKEYYQMHASQLSIYTGPSKETWSIHNDVVLVTGLELDFAQRDGRLNIFISENVKNEYTKIPVWVGPER
jgi:hypothetical protein